MHISSLAGKNICILGFGKEGQAMANAIERYAPTCEITIADQNEKVIVDNSKYRKQIGTGWLENLEKFDVLIKSPGISPSTLPATRYQLTSPTQIFLDSIASSGATVIGVTGSKGKSTTSSLIHHILQNAQGNQNLSVNSQQLIVNSLLVGNIGEPVISHIADAQMNTIFVQEMSSYQLMDLTVSPHVAVVTSFFPEHLDYHGSVEAYLEAKKHIARFQSKDDHIYVSTHEKECMEIAKESKGTIHQYSEADAPVSIEETKLKGRHNLRNIAAAFLVTTEQCGVPRKIAIEAIKCFIPLKHRLESIGIIDGIEWVNDSISTTPQSAIAAIDALGDRVKVIILGGQDRGYDFTPLVERIRNSSIESVILLPDSGRTIGEMMRKKGLKIELVDAATMQEAVRSARHFLPPSPPAPLPEGEGKNTGNEREHSVKKPVNATILKFARSMRKEPTKAEKLLWDCIRNRKIGAKFRRQHPLNNRIIDFYCSEYKLGIELDGSIHDNEEQQKCDVGRQQAIEEFDIRIIRFRNAEVLNDLGIVLSTIKQHLANSSPLPPGEGSGVREQGEGEGSGVRELPIVLLSPASPSYGHFKNFEERGVRFQQSISEISQ